MQIHIFLVPAVLNKEREMLIGREPVQIYIAHKAPTSEIRVCLYNASLRLENQGYPPTSALK
jgi:hypothetical protein